MATFFLALALGMVLGTTGCYFLLLRLRYMLADSYAADRLRIREEGLEAAQHIADASHRAQMEMLRVLIPGGDE